MFTVKTILVIAALVFCCMAGLLLGTQVPRERWRYLLRTTSARFIACVKIGTGLGLLIGLAGALWLLFR